MKFGGYLYLILVINNLDLQSPEYRKWTNQLETGEIVYATNYNRSIKGNHNGLCQ